MKPAAQCFECRACRRMLQNLLVRAIWSAVLLVAMAVAACWVHALGKPGSSRPAMFGELGTPALR